MEIPRLTIGRATVHLLNDGFWWDDGGAMFGVVPKNLWAREKPADHDNRIHMSLVCPLIVADGEVILVDTGIGNRLRAKEAGLYRPERRGGGLVGCLRQLGLGADSVTIIVLSHLHFDHCGGVVHRTDSDTVRATFPGARHVVQRREWEVAHRPPDARQAVAYRHVPECFGSLPRPRLELIDGHVSITPSVRTRMTGGHTPTHQCVVVESESAGLVHLADLAPTIPHLRAGWTAAYDLDPLQVMEEKTRLLAEIITKNWWVSFDHDDRVASARLQGEQARPTITNPIATPGAA